MDDRICPVCGKSFIPAVYHVYNITDRTPVCSWSCLCKYRHKHEAKKIVRGPKSIRLDVPVLMYDKTGKFIQRWPSIDRAAFAGNFDARYIVNCIKGKQQTYKGYIWKLDRM